MAVASAVPILAGRATRATTRPFLGLIDCVLVEDGGTFEFDGAIPREHAAAAWTWMVRDLAPDLLATLAGDEAPEVAPLEAALPELLRRAGQAITATAASQDAERRLRMQLGGEDPWRKLPQVISALKSRSLLDKAQNLGRAINGMEDDLQLASALQAMPLSDRALAALLMQAMVAQIANPARLVTSATKVAGSETEIAVTRAGFGPLVDAILAHAQNQLALFMQVGPFADVDLLCRALDRFHRLLRSVSALLDLTRNGRWAMVVGALTKTASDRIEPRIRSVLIDLNRALRRQREGIPDRLDTDQILLALGSVYILKTVREARDSLALNAVFDQTWTQVGQAIEIHIERNLDLLRKSPDDGITAERLDAAIKMAEIRIGTEYADVMRRARDSALRRQPPERGPEAG
jgi:hypothetical protein